MSRRCSKRGVREDIVIDLSNGGPRDKTFTVSTTDALFIKLVTDVKRSKITVKGNNGKTISYLDSNIKVVVDENAKIEGRQASTIKEALPENSIHTAHRKTSKNVDLFTDDNETFTTTPELLGHAHKYYRRLHEEANTLDVEEDIELKRIFEKLSKKK
eukprot:Awhi_evm1s10061